MAESGARSWRHGRRWLAVAVTLVAVAVAGIVIATQNSRSKTGFPVSLVLSHATILVYSSDAVEVVNKSKSRLATSRAAVSPRTSAEFRWPKDTGANLDTPGTLLAPHSILDEAVSPVATPGEYWVWTEYAASGSNAIHVAYTELTVLAP
jgi:hypothetical protein